MSRTDGRVITDLLQEVTGPAATAHQVAEETRKTVLNTLACAVGASRIEPMDTMIAASTPGSSSVVGTGKGVTLQRSALLNGMLAHFEDFDDTHATYRVHGGAPVVGAAVAIGSSRPIPGERFLSAIAAGMEFHYRLAGRMMPEHHHRGWHPTGTLGVLGAAVTSAVIYEGTLEQIEAAVEIASGMTVGVREVFGTEAKPFHAGKAAASGVLACRLAMAGRSGSGSALVGSDGYLASLAGTASLHDMTSWAPSDWELLRNTYKAYPCGRVIHSVIDAGIELGRIVGDGEIKRFEVRCHPMVLDVTGIMRPTTSLEAKFSSAYGFATGYLRGTARQQDFTETAVSDPDIAAVLDRVTIVDDASISDKDTVIATGWPVEGGKQTVEVSAALGSLALPMSFEDIYQKAVSLTEPLDPSIAPRLRHAIDQLAGGATSVDVIAACQPRPLAVQTRRPDKWASRTGAGPDTSPAHEARSATDAAVAFCLLATPPPSAIDAVDAWYSACKPALSTEGYADSGRLTWKKVEVLDDEPGPRRAFVLGSRLGSLAPPGLPRLLLPVVAAIHGVCGHHKCEPDELRTALAIGLEIGLRLRQAVTERHENDGWDIAGSLGPIAAASSLARLSGDAASTARALLTLTGTQIGGLGMRSRARLTDINVAVAAAAAAEAQALVATGMRPSVDIIGGRRGLLNVLNGSDRPTQQVTLLLRQASWVVTEH